MKNLNHEVATTFYGDKLRLIRQFYGFSLTELGDLVSATRQYIHQLETDVKSPSEEMKNALATVLNVYPSFFGSKIKNAVKVENTHFRKLKSTNVSTVNQTLAHGTLLEILIDYLETHLQLPTVDFPQIQIDKFDNIDGIADYCRSHWELGHDGPISNMTRVLENAGAVVTLFRGVSDKLDALSMSRSRPIIVRSTLKESLCRMRFDLAHECGHLVMHSGIETGDKFTESQANRFASAFLLPAKAFLKEFPKSSRMNWNEIYKLKLLWKTSVGAIVRRAHDLDLIDAVQYRRANIYLSKTGQKKQEKFDDKMPLEQPELLNTCLNTLNNNNRLYLDGICEELEFKTDVLETLLHSIQLDDFYIKELPENVVSLRHHIKKHA